MSTLFIKLKYSLKNPITIYIQFLINLWHNKFKFHKVKQGYLTFIKNSNIAANIKIYERVMISDSQIDSYTYVNHDTQISKASIGKFCCIGPNCLLGLAAHPSKDFVSSHPIFYSTRKQVGITFSDRDYFEERKGIVKIGNDVWMGTNVVVFDDITIGDGAIIAAGAIVNKNVPPYAIYGGVPAKLIRYRFEPEIIDFLLAFKWWNKDEEWLKSHFKGFHNINEFVNQNVAFK